MIVDYVVFVGYYYIVGQQVLLGVVFGDDFGQQVVLGWDDFIVFIGVFVEQCGVGLFDEVVDFLIEMVVFFMLVIVVMVIFNVGVCQLFIGVGYQLVFYCGLDFVDVDLGVVLYLLVNDFCDGGVIVCVIDFCCFSCMQNCFLNVF